MVAAPRSLSAWGVYVRGMFIPHGRKLKSVLLLQALRRSFRGRPPVEPTPCCSSAFTAADGCHYLWRGVGQGQGSDIIAIYDSSTELWSLLPTTGPLPPGEYGGCSVCVGRCLYTFGGEGAYSCFNNMHKLDLDTLQWSEVQSSGIQPMKKQGCGLVRVNEKTLCCFGGEGTCIGPTQPGSTFTKTRWSGVTNEFHLFDIETGNFCVNVVIAYT